MLSLGGVRHLTGGSRHEGTVTCETLLNLCNGKAVELEIEQGAKVTVQTAKPPIVDGVLEERMRVGCGSATIGMFAKQWFGKVDEVVVVDDHITGVLSEHQAGKLPGIPETGIKLKRRRFVACWSYRESGQADALSSGRAHSRHLWRSSRLCVAGWRNHNHGRRLPHAGERIRICADASAGCANRVHNEAGRLRHAGWLLGSCPAFAVDCCQPTHFRETR